MQKFTPSGVLTTHLAQLQAQAQRARPAAAPGVLVSRTTRGFSYRPTGRSTRRQSTSTSNIARWA